MDHAGAQGFQNSTLSHQMCPEMMNLAVNARDAMPEGGTLTITCRNETGQTDVLPTTLSRGEYVRLSVADSGFGISQDTLAKAMEPFFTTKGVGKGTGLGLSGVRDIELSLNAAVRCDFEGASSEGAAPLGFLTSLRRLRCPPSPRPLRPAPFPDLSWNRARSGARSRN